MENAPSHGSSATNNRRPPAELAASPCSYGRAMTAEPTRHVVLQVAHRLADLADLSAGRTDLPHLHTDRLAQRATPCSGRPLGGRVRSSAATTDSGAVRAAPSPIGMSGPHP